MLVREPCHLIHGFSLRIGTIGDTSLLNPHRGGPQLLHAQKQNLALKILGGYQQQYLQDQKFGLKC